MPEAPRRAARGGLIRSTVLRRLTLAMMVGSLMLATFYAAIVGIASTLAILKISFGS